MGADLPSDAGETKISFGQKSLCLDPWAIGRLKETLGEGAPPDEYGVLLTEIVALLLKCMADTERFGAASTGKVEEYYRLQAELMLDSNLGNSLISRAQSEVESLVHRGMTQDARQLSGVLHKLRRSLVEVNRNAGTKVETPSSEETVQPIATPTRAVERVADPSEYDDSDEEELSYPEPPVVGSARTRVLGGLLALALGIWFVAVELPKIFDSHPRQLRISELQVPAVELSLQSRWPGLYVEVRGEAWNALDSEERERLVADLVESATQRNFTSILVRTMDGRSLVQWWHGRDVQWVDTSDGVPSIAAGSDTPDAIETGRPAS